jgi:hypothetical protein
MKNKMTGFVSEPSRLFVLFLTVVLILIGLNSRTTGDSGDSVMHYLYSHYAFKHPVLFFDHWAKPVFVLLSAPFSAEGFTGMKLFNIACSVVSGFITYKIAVQLKLRSPLLVFAFFYFSPLYFKLLYSGLTEYLFSLVLIASYYLFQQKKHTIAAIIISFLPLVRSEGLLFFPVVVVILCVYRKFKLIPLLFAGLAIFSVLGSFVYRDLLWLFNTNPYATLSSPYGHGHFYDMIFRLNYVIEKPIYILLATGIIAVGYNFIRRSSGDNFILFVLISFIVFFVSHSLFWWLGIFNSFGLPRVFICVMPLIALLALQGLDVIVGFFSQLGGRIATMVMVAIVLSFPFTSRSQGIRYDRDLFTNADCDLIDDSLRPVLKSKGVNDRTLYFSHPYIAVALDVDWFDYNAHQKIREVPQSNGAIPKNSLVIWDDWFARVEDQVPLEYLLKMPALVQTSEVEKMVGERKVRFVVFEHVHSDAAR